MILMFSGRQLVSGSDVVGTPIRRREIDLPEPRRGSLEFQRDVKSLGRLAGRADHFAADALSRAAVLQYDVRVGWKALFHHDDGTLRCYA